MIMLPVRRNVPRLTSCLLLLAVSTGLAADDRAVLDPIAPEVAEQCNLVQNGGFEEGNAAPAYWNRHPPTDSDGNRLLRDATVAHRGGASGLIVGMPPRPGVMPANLQWNRYGIPVEGGSALILSCFVKTEGTTPFRIGCHFYDEKRRHLGFQGVPFPSSNSEWTYLREQVTVPDAARQMGFVLYADPTGRTWYDDVAVLGTPTAAAVRGTPKIDGKLNDACWPVDQAISRFAVHTGTKLPSERTLAWLAYDNDGLYVALRCPHPNGATLQAECDQHDGKVWLDDSVEVFLDPNHDHHDYFQLCINCRGQIRDSRGTDLAWESAAEAIVDRSGDAWTVEVKIPYDHLDIGVDAGTIWGINLVRNDRVHGETSTWSLGGLHDARRFGNVMLEPDLWRFRRNGLLEELAIRQGDIDRLRDEMREAGMTDRAMAVPERILREAEECLRQLGRRIGGQTGDDSKFLAELRQALADLPKRAAEARSAATEYLLTTQQAGPGSFRVAIAHSLQKVPRDRPWSGGVFANRVRLEAARDETESFQLVIIPDETSLQGVTVEPSALRGDGGEIPVQWRRVDYVETIEPKYPTEYVGWWPDPLLPPEPVDVQAGQRQPLWFSVDVPPEASPGLYSGQVTIRHGKHRIAVPVELRVRTFRLPRPGTLATAFGNYANVLSEGYYGKGDYRRNMAIDDYARWCKFMGRYRIGAKNMGREYVRVARERDNWRADLSALTETVGKLVPKFYAPYSVGMHRLPSSPNLSGDNLPNTSDWARQTAAIAREWQRLGLSPEAFLYGVDEPAPAHYPLLRDAYQKLREAVPEYPIMQTVNHQEPAELAGLVGIWCPLSSRLDSNFYAERRKAGDTLWTYVCCGPTHPYANFFVDRPATEHRVLFWQTRKAGATGVLYWCVCYWQGLPLPGTGKPSWPEVPMRFEDLGTATRYKVNGDGVLLYPGPGFEPCASLRLEVIRDGIEDYEYLALLSRLVEQARALPVSKRPDAERLADAERLCTVPDEISRSMADYTQEPDDIFDRRKEIGDMIDQLVPFVAP